MAELKQLRELEGIFYPVTVGEGVIFKDGTNAEITEPQMDLIFDWTRNYAELTSTDDTDNYIVIKNEGTPSNISQG